MNKVLRIRTALGSGVPIIDGYKHITSTENEKYDEWEFVPESVDLCDGGNFKRGEDNTLIPTGNPLDRQYQALLQDILDNGAIKGDRTGTGTTSVFGRMIRHKMSDGFPLLTTKKMYMKGIVTELIWFLRGDTNIQWLVENKCNIWNGDAYKRYYNEECIPPHDHTLDKDQFAQAIKENKDPFTGEVGFAEKWGDLGPSYGFQWRNFNGTKTATEVDKTGNPIKWENTGGVDQIAQIIDSLKNNPDGRRIIVSAWNPTSVDKVVLPPCHYSFQLWTRELTWDEHVQWVMKNTDVEWENLYIVEEIAKDSTPKREVSLLWNQRSCDTFLGLPFNIASYGLLLTMLAMETNMVPGDLIGSIGDTHLYSNHLDEAREQISRTSFDLPQIELNNWTKDYTFLEAVERMTPDLNFYQLHNYKSHEKIKAELSN